MGNSGKISSPLYPETYEHSKSITWKIIVDPNYNIFIKFLDFSEKFESCGMPGLSVSKILNQLLFRANNYFSFKIYDGPDAEHPSLGSFCGFVLPKSVTTTSNIAFISLYADSISVGMKFLLEYNAVKKPTSNLTQIHIIDSKIKCGSKEVIDLSKLIVFNLTSPGYPNGFDSKLNCEWIFSTTPENHIAIALLDLDLGDTQHDFCFADRITVYEGVGGMQDWKYSKAVCHVNGTTLISVPSNYMKITFNSYNDNPNKTKFSAVALQGKIIY